MQDEAVWMDGNQYFTTPAVEAARKLKILLWDGGYVESMMEEE
jgi:restriction system protein